ncbi:hypothetical protein [Sulfuricurvum sp.]|uniref:hypothetical protein n=1 Tax=Sulfuricurvum sp. TaxID=2025608 RepID=UPI003BB7B2EA
MSLCYAGPKPLISSHGIEFDHNKEDKFVYLSFVAELIHALDHEYIDGERYITITEKKPLDPDTIFSLINTYDSALDQKISDRIKKVEEEIATQIEHAHSNRLLCDEEHQVLVKNIEFLHQYRIQRAINKTVYYSGIKSLAHIIQKGHIDYIIAPMFPIFVHVFHSIQGALTKLSPPINSEIDIYEENEHLKVQLNLKKI